MAEQKPSRGFSGTLVKLWRGGDYELTVTGRTEISPHYLRLHFDSGSLLAERPLHPTMWVRGWFPDGEKSHQRGYTLVNADPERRNRRYRLRHARRSGHPLGPGRRRR